MKQSDTAVVLLVNDRLMSIDTFKGVAGAAAKRLKQFKDFFADAEHRARDLRDEQRERTIGPLRLAHALIVSTDVLERFDARRVPEKR